MILAERSPVAEMGRMRSASRGFTSVLLATHFNGQPFPIDHGAPLRLLIPVKRKARLEECESNP